MFLQKPQKTMQKKVLLAYPLILLSTYDNSILLSLDAQIFSARHNDNLINSKCFFLINTYYTFIKLEFISMYFCRNSQALTSTYQMTTAG